MPRGRKPILQDRKTTCVSLESRHVEFLQQNGIELSEFLRDNIEALMKSKDSPIERTKKEIVVLKESIRNQEIELHQKETLLQELQEKEDTEQQQAIKLNEFEEKRRNYIISCISQMQKQQTYNRVWLEHLVEAWKYINFEAAKLDVCDIWIEHGVPEKKAKSYLRLN